MYRPTRKFKKPSSLQEEDEETQVSCTLLEYGRRYALGQLKKASKGKESKEAAKAAIAASLGGKEEDASAEEVRETKLMCVV